MSETFSDVGELISRDAAISCAIDTLKTLPTCSIGTAQDRVSDAIRALPAACAEVSVAEAATIPEDVVELVLRIGRAEWGATVAKSADEHAAALVNSIRRTDEHFKTEGPHRMTGLYIEGTDIVICHSGTSPNSMAIARALTGAWNRLHDEATDLRALTEAGE